MFDIGWTELALIGVAAIVVVGPEEMPHLLYKLGKLVRKARLFTSDIQRSLDRIVNETEVDDLANEINQNIAGPELNAEIERQIAVEEDMTEPEEEESRAIN